MSKPYFLCHNSKEKVAVRAVRDALEQNGVKTWFDEKDIPPGVKWYEYIFEHIDECAGAVVFLGPHGIGPTQYQEIDRVLRGFEELRKPVVPVLLPGYHEEKPPIPAWIREQLVAKWNYVDLSIDPARMLLKLASALAAVPVNDSAAIGNAAGRIPRASASIAVDGWFVAIWVVLHLVGYLAISKLVEARAALDHPNVYAVLATSIILFALVAVGWPVVRSRSVVEDWHGAFVGVLTAIMASSVLVGFAPSSDGGIRAIGALATTFAAGFLGGVSAGWIAGCAIAAFAGVGAFVAAVLVPMDQVKVPAQDVVGYVGAMMWGAILSTLLLKAIRRSTQLRAVLRD